jgi:hypothetical protein
MCHPLRMLTVAAAVGITYWGECGEPKAIASRFGRAASAMDSTAQTGPQAVSDLDNCARLVVHIVNSPRAGCE